jgi:hypothetical protein
MAGIFEFQGKSTHSVPERAQPFVNPNNHCINYLSKNPKLTDAEGEQVQQVTGSQHPTLAV